MDSFDVVTLGAPGAGTTMFLAAMFGQLQGGQPGNGPFLDITLAQARMLQRILAAASDPQGGWPDTTPPSPVPEWEFTCCVRSAGRIFEVFGINYLDFAGGRLQQVLDGDAETGRRFQQRVTSAHALLGVLDGLALRYLLDDDPRAERLVSLGMRTIFRIMRTHARGRPIHFIVTKWDLLADAYELGDVRAKLMEFGDFAALVQSARSGPPGAPAPLVRLIPVSALGFGFAQLDEEGRVRKTGAAAASPINAEIPLIALPIDVLAQAPQAQAPQAQAPQAAQAAQGQAPQAAQGHGPAGVVDQRSALRETVRSFRRQLDRFEERYPAALPDRQSAGDWSPPEAR